MTAVKLHQPDSLTPQNQTPSFPRKAGIHTESMTTRSMDSSFAGMTGDGGEFA
jgi:hypothetical protein